MTNDFQNPSGSHPDDGRLQGYLDRELPLDGMEEVERHLLRCPPCQARLDELRAVADRVTRALDELDRAEASDVGAALWNVRRLRARRRSEAHRRRLAAAAVVLLFMGAGAAVALPGSPVRDWLAGSGEPPVAVEPSEAAAPGAALALALEGGQAVVQAEDLGAEVGVHVRVIPGSELRVEAPPGAAFRSGSGRIEVSGGADEGLLRVEIPAEARRVEVRLGGETRVEFRNGTLRVDGRVVDAPPSQETGEWIQVVSARGGPEGGRREP